MRRVAAGLLLGLVVLAGCSGTSTGHSASQRTGKATTGGGVAPVGPAGATPAGDFATVPAGSQPLDGRAVISNATLAVRVRRVGTGSADAIGVVAAAGGTLFSENAAFGRQRDATLVFKVPPAQFRAVLDRLQAIGRPVDEQVSTDDVTAQVVDLDGRLASATASATRLRALFDTASNVGDVVAIEGELVRREAEVESLQGQLRVLQTQVQLATITLTLTPLGPAPRADATPTGFAAGLARGWAALVVAIEVGATLLGVLLPFLGLGALGLGAFVAARRRLRPPAQTRA